MYTRNIQWLREEGVVREVVREVVRLGVSGREIKFSHETVRWTKDLLSTPDFGHTITRSSLENYLKLCNNASKTLPCL